MADMENNTRIALQQISEESCGVNVIIKNNVQATVEGCLHQQTFRMITGSAGNDFNINPITIDGL